MNVNRPCSRFCRQTRNFLQRTANADSDDDGRTGIGTGANHGIHNKFFNSNHTHRGRKDLQGRPGAAASTLGHCLDFHIINAVVQLGMDQRNVQCGIVTAILTRDGMDNHGAHRELSLCQFTKGVVKGFTNAVTIGKIQRSLYKEGRDTGILAHDHAPLASFLSILDQNFQVLLAAGIGFVFVCFFQCLHDIGLDFSERAYPNFFNCGFQCGFADFLHIEHLLFQFARRNKIDMGKG